MKGLEPSTFAMARRRSSQLSYIRASRKCNAIPGPPEALARAPHSPFERRASRVAERLIARAHRRAEALPGGLARECVALLGVARDPVEDRAEDLRRVQSLCVQRLIDEQLHHHELVHGNARDARSQRLDALVELRRVGGLD